MRNLSVALLMAHGVPMITMGDEYGHTKLGNNNTYCHDSELNWFNWDQVRLAASNVSRDVSRSLSHWRHPCS
jgi:pullulanase/glycogen debranching enzyme